MSDKGARGRPRSSDVDRMILDATLELLRSKGPGAVNIDAVAARSGVARTSIYRRFRSRDELLGSALDHLVAAPLPPPAVPVADKLRWALEQVLVLFDRGLGPGGTAAILTDSDPAFTEALRERLTLRVEELSTAMAEDIAAGRMSSHVDPETLVGLLLGGYLGEVLRHGRLDPDWAERTLGLLLPAVIPDE